MDEKNFIELYKKVGGLYQRIREHDRLFFGLIPQKVIGILNAVIEHHWENNIGKMTYQAA